MWNNGYFEFLVRQVWKIDKPVNILDVGCGYGDFGLRLLSLIPEGSSYNGIDIAADLIQKAKDFFKISKYATRFEVACVPANSRMEMLVFAIKTNYNCITYEVWEVPMSYKKTDALMRHLRDSGISIQGHKQKRQLINTGYFHGYKGYRFFGNAQRRLPFTSYDEVYATIQYDSDLKALLYGKMMFIETAVKNIALESILVNSNSESIQDMYDKVVSGYNNAPVSATVDQKRKLQQNKLNLQNSIQASLAYAYKKNNPKITHFYNNIGYSDVPVWALFEIMTMGDLGYLLSCLTYDVRDDISKRLSLNVSCDTDRQLLYKYIYTLKDLRNAIAHNAVVFDTRFRNIDPSHAMKQCLKLEVGLPYVNFKTIGDYIILMCYYLKLLEVSKTEIKAFIRDFEKITDNYEQAVNPTVAAIVIHPDLSSRMNILKNYL